MDSNVKRGDIFYADLSPVVGSEQGGVRPVLVVQNDTGNRYSPTIIAAAITSQLGKARLPTHIGIAGGSVGLSRDSIILLEQIRTIDKKRLREHMGHQLPPPQRHASRSPDLLPHRSRTRNRTAAQKTLPWCSPL